MLVCAAMPMFHAVMLLTFLERVPLIAGCGVAICFSGHFRSFSASELLRESIKNNLVDALNVNAEFGCGSDVFAYLSQSEASNESETLAKFMSTFKPIRFEVAPPDERSNASILPPRPTEQQISRKSTWKYAENPSGVIELARSQYKKIMRCYNLVLEHEGQRGRYAWVVRARFDAGWYRPLPPLSTFRNDRVLVKNNLYHSGVQDQFFLAPRHLSDAAFGAAAWLFDNEAPRWWSPGLFWQPETFLWKAWSDCGVPFGRASIPMILVRGDGDAHCFTNKPWATSMSMLENMINQDIAPGGTHLAGAIRRAETAACLRGFRDNKTRHLVWLDPPYNAKSNHAYIEVSSNPTLNALVVLQFCNDIGIISKLECDAFAEGLWHKNIPINLQSKQHSTEQEIQWVVRELLALTTPGESDFNLSYVFDFVNEDMLALNTPTFRTTLAQRLCVSPRLLAAVARAAVCVYISSYGLLMANSASVHEWPNVSEVESCLESLHETEQSIEAVLDAHKLTYPTWGGAETESSRIIYQGRHRTKIDVDVRKSEEASVVSC